MRRAAIATLALSGLLVFSSGCSFFNTENADTSDAAITARVKQSLKQHPELDIQYLDVDTHQGVVTISGIILTEEARYQVVWIIRRVQGVQQVIANLVIRQ